MSLSTHVLDMTLGVPAAGVAIRLEHGAETLDEAVTDGNGRIGALGADLEAGTYRIVFDTGTYFGSGDRPVFYPEVAVSFVISDPARHHHVPLLLSPFGYSTYLGS